MKSGVKRCHSQHPLKIKLYTQVSNKGLDVIICNPQSRESIIFSDFLKLPLSQKRISNCFHSDWVTFHKVGGVPL